MQELAYKTYLIGQCGKLSHASELEAYVIGSAKRRALPPDFWKLLEHEPTIEQTAAFAELKYRQGVVDGLPLNSLAKLTKLFCEHHDNGVYGCIVNTLNWQLESLEMAETEVGYVESSLKEIVQKHEHRLLEFAADPTVLNNPNYRDRDPSREMEDYDVFLVKWTSNRPRLIDGNHRAIHKARQLLNGYSTDSRLKVVAPGATSPNPMR